MSRIIEGDLLRDMHHLLMIISRHARDRGGSGRDAALGILGVLSEKEKEDLSHIIRKINASFDQARR